MEVFVGFLLWVFLFWFAWKWFQFTILSKFISPGGQRAMTVTALREQNRLLKMQLKEAKNRKSEYQKQRSKPIIILYKN